MNEKRKSALVQYLVLTVIVLVVAFGIAWYEISQYVQVM